MTVSTLPYCPVCDPRAIGLPGDESPRPVVVEHLLDAQREVVARCQCGAIFNTGTARTYGAHMVPLTLRAFRSLVTDAFCTCNIREAGAVDVNYIDANGVEQRAHGFVHNKGIGACYRWTQTG